MKAKEEMSSPRVTRQEAVKLSEAAERRRDLNRQYKRASRARQTPQKRMGERMKERNRKRKIRDERQIQKAILIIREREELEKGSDTTQSQTLPSPLKPTRTLIDNLKTKRDKTSLNFVRQIAAAHEKHGISMQKIGLSGRTTRSKATGGLYRRLGNGKREMVRVFFTENSYPDPSKPHRRQLLKSVKELYTDFRRKHPSVRLSLASFFRYRPSAIKSVKLAVFRQCQCDICLNPKLKLSAINKWLPSESDAKFECVRDLLERTVCEFVTGMPKLECVERKCKECGVEHLQEHLEEALHDSLCERVSWFEWATVRVGKVSRLDRIKKTGFVQECLDELMKELQTVYLHVFTADWQRRQLQDLKKDLPSDWALAFCDYSENFHCKMQDAAQSTYYSQKQITLFPAVVFYNCPCGEGMKREEIAFFNDDLRHDAYMTQAFVDRIVAVMHERLGSSLKKVILASDGCAAQFKSKLPFLLFSRSVQPGVSVEKVFFGSRHGKNDSDWSGGAIKRLLNRHLASGVDLKNAKDAHRLCTDTMTIQGEGTACTHKARQFHHLEQSEVVRICQYFTVLST